MKTKYLLYFALITLVVFSASAAASDYTLDIFGNANEDETVNMQDVTYTELIILEYQDATELADAKYDGEIDILDVTQIELIILGKEKELTILDSADRTVTVNKPLERTVILSYAVAEAAKIVKADEKIVGISSDIKKRTTFFPELSKLPPVGVSTSPDVEKITELNPDIVFTGRYQSMGDDLADKLPDTTAITCWDTGRVDLMQNNVMILGYLLDSREEAEQFCNFYQEYIDETIQERLSEISESDKQRVYLEHLGDNMAMTVGSSGHEICVAAVTNDRVYLIDRDLFGSTANFISITYLAKWLYPDLFEDLDPEAFHQEYLTEFQRLDYDLSEHGVFVYPLLEEI